ncbi:MAG: sigma-70 family RNA polymerase sigma factor [Myxococcales bacterium]
MLQSDAELEAHRELVERIVRALLRELDLSCDPDDLRAWGFQGLLEAKQRFDASRGVRFSAFAHYRIRGAILDGVRSQGFLRRRAYARLKAFEATDAIAEQLAEEQANRPTSEGTLPGQAATQQRAEDLDAALGKITAAFLISAVGQGEERAPEAPDRRLESAQEQSLVHASLEQLPERERTLLQAVYFEGITIEEAGARLGLSKSWASRLHAKALDRMRKQLEAL